MMVRLYEVVDREIILAVIEPRVATDDLLELNHRVDGALKTMLRILRASTPVESFCDVVRIVGIVFSLSWKSRRCCSPRLPSLAVTR